MKRGFEFVKVYEDVAFENAVKMVGGKNRNQEVERIRVLLSRRIVEVYKVYHPWVSP